MLKSGTMFSKRDKVIYITSILLFSVSFGYFALFSLLYLLKNIGNILPFGFFNSGFGAFLDALFFAEVSVGPMLLCFGLCVVSSVLLLAGFWGQFRLGNIIFTAAAPFFLLFAMRGVATVMDALSTRFSFNGAPQTVFAVLAPILLTAYAVGFYAVMHYEQKQLQSKTENP